MSTMTVEAVMSLHEVAIPEHLVRDAEVPALSGSQRQGDVFVIPQRPGVAKGSTVPPEGVPVVRGGNTHLLAGEGIAWRVLSGQPDLGVVTVPEGRVAYLLHPEHGANAFAPGEYLLRRQVEQAGQIRMVAD